MNKKIHMAMPMEEKYSQIISTLERVAINNFIQKIVLFPDTHQKKSMEFPSSTAVAVKNYIVPQFTSASVNCGMAFITTDLNHNIMDRKTCTTFFNSIKSQISMTTWSPNISYEEAFHAIVDGPDWFIKRDGLEAEIAEIYQNCTKTLFERDSNHDLARRINPEFVIKSGQNNFGLMGTSNHFIEIQCVDEIIDESVCKQLDIEKDKISIMYHGGGGVYNGIIGRMFVPRKKDNLKLKFKWFLKKIPFHLNDADNIIQRLSLYFRKRDFSFIDIESKEGIRFAQFNTYAMNFGNAHRLSGYTDICKALRNVSTNAKLKLLCDLPHNVISKEVVDEEEVVVHRHNSVRCLPPSKLKDHPIYSKTGLPIILPGLNSNSSFLCVADEGARDYLFSVDHGAGENISEFIKAGKSKQIDRTTMKFNHFNDDVKEIVHYDDSGIQSVIDKLVERRIVRPIARLRPIAGLN